MALTLVDVNAYTNRFIVPKSTDVIYKNSPVWTRIHTRQAERFEGGTQIVRPIMFAELNGTVMTRGTSFDISFVNTDTAFVVNPKGYWVNISLFGFDDILNRGPEAVFSQVELKMANASMKMAKLLATDIYNDGGNTRASGNNSSTTLSIDGFEAWIDDGNLYTSIGGITRTDLAAAGVISGANAYTNTSFNAFTLAGIQTAWTNAWFGSDHVDLITCSMTGWNNFWNSIQPLQRYMDTQSDVGKIGFMTFRFNSAEVVYDQYLPISSNSANSVDSMYGLNTNYIELYCSTNPRMQFGFTGFKEAQNTIDVSGQFLFAGDLVIPNPRCFFKLQGTGV